MTPRSLTLAALACAAVPGLAPVSVTEVSAPNRRGPDRFHTAVVTDSQGARWVVRMPADPVAAARQDAVQPLLRLVGSRLPFAVPAPAGRKTLRDGRGVVVYPCLPGEPLDFVRLPSRSQLAARVGKALAAVHNLDRRLVDEASLPTYEAEDCRRRHVADLDRAAATRRIPTGLLSRWERMLDDVSRWRFAPTVVHGRLDGARILAKASDPNDSDTAEITGIVGWDEACVADPAMDFAALVHGASPEAADTVFEAYAMARTEPADPMLLERAALIAELDLLAAFLAAVLAEDHEGMTRVGAELADLDARVGDRDAPARADEEPLFETVPLNFSPPPVESGIYRAGDVDTGRARVGSDDPTPSQPPPPRIELDARQQDLSSQPPEGGPLVGTPRPGSSARDSVPGDTPPGTAAGTSSSGTSSPAMASPGTSSSGATSSGTASASETTTSRGESERSAPPADGST